MAFAAVLVIGSVAIMNLTAEFVRLPPSPFPTNGAKIPSQTRVNTANWVMDVAPFRTDLKSDFALTDPCWKAIDRIGGKLVKSGVAAGFAVTIASAAGVRPIAFFAKKPEQNKPEILPHWR